MLQCIYGLKLESQRDRSLDPGLVLWVLGVVGGFPFEHGLHELHGCYFLATINY